MQAAWSQIIIATYAQLINDILVELVAIIDCFVYPICFFIPEGSMNNVPSIEVNGDISELELTNLNE